MTLTVEDGTGLAGADSYSSVATADAYTSANGLEWPADLVSKEAALRRATLWIDTTFRSRFPGYRLNRRAQAREWPRSEAWLRDQGGGGPTPPIYTAIGGYTSSSYDPFWGVDRFDCLPPNVVPIEIVNATIEAASRESQQVGLLMGDAEVRGSLKRERAGDTQQEWFSPPVVQSATSGGLRFPVIDAILDCILISRSGYTARAARA